jgi:hypothetical protein
MNGVSSINQVENCKREQILLEFLISDIVRIVLLYMDKHKLKYDKSQRLEGKQVLTDGKKIYIHDMRLNTIKIQSELDQRSLQINQGIYQIPKNHVLTYMIDENTCMIFKVLDGKPQYEIFNIKTAQIIKNIPLDKNITALCSNDKYIIFYNVRDKIIIFSIKEMKFIQEINISFEKINIIDDILYIQISGNMIICKYDMKGEQIGTIIIKNPSTYDDITISTNEIVVFCYEEITFYDLTGNLISKTKIDRRVKYDYVITQDHLYIADENDGYTYYIYKRML